jgi:hypothetical protein
MISREERLEWFEFYALERDCLVCSEWPRAERPRRRTTLNSLPFVHRTVCARCWMAFVKNFCVTVENEEEGDALREAVHEERRRGSERPAKEILQDLRRKRTKH